MLKAVRSLETTWLILSLFFSELTATALIAALAAALMAALAAALLMALATAVALVMVVVGEFPVSIRVKKCI